MAVPDFSWPVRRLDAWLRVHLGIKEFTAEPDCIFRISREAARRSLMLADGATIQPGDPVLQVHLWNEHLPLMAEEGRTAAWANLFKHRMILSFELLADYVEREPRFDDIVAIHASPPFPERLGAEFAAPAMPARRVGNRPAGRSQRSLAWLARQHVADRSAVGLPARRSARPGRGAWPH